MKLSDIQLIQWPRGYRRIIRKVAEADGLSVNEWLEKKVSEELKLPVRAEVAGKTTAIPQVTNPGRSVDPHETRSSRLAGKMKKLKNWLWRRESVFHESVDQYLEHPQPVQVTIPLQGGETRRFSAIAKLQGGTKRMLLAELPEENLFLGNEIDTSKQCLVTFKLNGKPRYMPTSIESVPDRKRLILQDKGFGSASVERRACLRINASFTLEYKRQKQHGFRQTQSIDLNTKGIQFQCRETLKIGEILVLNLKLPRPEPYLVLCNARVVWSREVSYNTRATGCQFLNLTGKDRDAISDFCLREIVRRERRQRGAKAG
ncbi:MAG: PilZ domain-containing protein [Desulfohalobiaceae bacterium]